MLILTRFILTNETLNVMFAGKNLHLKLTGRDMRKLYTENKIQKLSTLLVQFKQIDVRLVDLTLHEWII